MATVGHLNPLYAKHGTPQNNPHHSNLGLYYEARHRNSPYHTHTGRGTYFDPVDVCSLPTLRETPSEHDSSGNSAVFDPATEFDDEAYRYYVTNGHVPHLPLGEEVFTYYSPHNGDPVLYYSGDEEVEGFDRRSPYNTRQSRDRVHSSASESSSVSRMGSAGSAMPPPTKKSQKSGSRHRRCSDSSDNGGFPTSSPSSATSSKSHQMGMKEKLRASLDKISLKPAFRWNSADKLSVLSTSSKSSKSKNGSKTARRCVLIL